MTWNDELDELRLRTSLAEAMGGEEKSRDSTNLAS